MYLLAPDILELTRQLSPAVSALGGLVGLLLWLLGARSHRFWLSLVVTVSAGVAGLSVARDFDVQPLVAALLLALSAGLLSLALARITLFLAGGVAFLVLLRASGLAWNEFVCFLAGGLVGVVLYRLWIMAVSSLVGTLLFSYAFFSLLDHLGQLDSVAWAARHGPLLNWGLGGWVVLGVLAQFVLDRRRQGKKATARSRKKKEERPAPVPPPPPPPPKPKWWQVGTLFHKDAA